MIGKCNGKSAGTTSVDLTEPSKKAEVCTSAPQENAFFFPILILAKKNSLVWGKFDVINEDLGNLKYVQV